jgi:shikimate 5-dehydrogenase
VLDVVYARETPLLADARRHGIDAIPGLRVLVAQAVRQFERMTGVRPPPAALLRAGRRWLAARRTVACGA